MRSIQRTSQFKRDVKRMQKRGKAFSEFKQVVGMLSAGMALEPHHRDHDLSGQYKGTRECHIEPDWLLIYELTKDEIILIRTGTHSDLFD
jgi:mRNA interferase YafQ